jgi:prophage endopeptidase
MMATAIRALLPWLAAIVAGFIFGWWVTSNRYDADLSKANAEHAQQMKKISDAASEQVNETIAKVKDAQSQVAELNQKSYEALTNAQNANASLRNDVAAGKRRVLIAQSKLTTCQRAGSAVSGPGGVVDAESVELTGTAGSDILDIRSGIISDRSKITYLQNYISLLQSKGVISGGKTKSQSPGVSK